MFPGTADSAGSATVLGMLASLKTFRGALSTLAKVGTVSLEKVGLMRRITALARRGAACDASAAAGLSSSFCPTGLRTPAAKWEPEVRSEENCKPLAEDSVVGAVVDVVKRGSLVTTPVVRGGGLREIPSRSVCTRHGTASDGSSSCVPSLNTIELRRRTASNGAV